MFQNLNSALKKLARDRRGQGMVEYALLVAGVALVCVVGVSMMGHKTADLIGTTAAILPGAHDDDNGPIAASQLVETKFENGVVQADSAAIGSNSRRLNANLGLGSNDDAFITDVPGDGGNHN